MTPALAARGIRVAYGGRPAAALDALDAAPGEVVALLGRNGAGKSTLLRILALVEAPSAGSVALGGREVLPGEREARRREATLALPHPYLFAGSAARNVALGLAARGVPRAERRERAARLLDALGLAALADRDAKRLSSGEAARVSLARALVLETPILLLDEPFAHLDPAAIPAAREAVAARAAAGTAVIVAALQREGLAGLPAREVAVEAPAG